LVAAIPHSVANGPNHLQLLRNKLISEWIVATGLRTKVIHQPSDVISLKPLAAFFVRALGNAYDRCRGTLLGLLSAFAFA
jgi:hypothetical protein